MSPSKTARRSTTSSTNLTPAMKVTAAATSPAPRLVPLAGGRGVYFHNPVTGRSQRLATSSDELIEALREPCALGLAGRIRRELDEFAQTYPKAGWDTTIARLQKAGVLN